MEHDMHDFGLDMNVIYVDRSWGGEENQGMAAKDRTVIDLQRYKILKTMRTVMNER